MGAETSTVTPAPHVAFVRDEVRENLEKWSLISDCLAGQDKIKAGGEKYLPMPNKTDESTENLSRYKDYKERAVFYGVTKRTLDGLIGQVFMRPPVIELDEKLQKVFLIDVDGSGVGLIEQSKKSLGDTMSYGRRGLLSDYPETAGIATAAQIEAGYIRPTITAYSQFQIINWRTVTVGARKLLSLVVLHEYVEAEDDGFEQAYIQQWRVLKLENGLNGLVYKVELWREAVLDGNKVTAVAKTTYPKDKNGKNFSEIPFTFIGSVNNDPFVDPAPLYDLAVLNIGHYRNNADYQESCFLVGQPTLAIAGLTEHWVKNVLGNSVQMGSRSAIPLPEGGSAQLLQVGANSMPKESMEMFERQMVALGARLVEQRNVQRTLGEAQIEESGETSILTSVTKNVSAAYTQALKFCAMFAGVDPEKIKYELNTDFIAANLTPEERAQLIADWQAGAIGYTELRIQYRKAGIATLKDEQAKAEAEADTMRMGPAPLVGKPGNSLTGGANNGRTAGPKQNGKTQ